VVEPLLALEREDVTGILEFRAQGITTRIYARDGELVFADAGTLGETLGRMLIRCGRLTEEQVAAVIRRMTDALVDNEHVRFGEIVVEYGFLTFDELGIALTQQVKEKIMGCVHRGPGEWTFSKDDERVDEVGTYVVRTRPLLVEAAVHLPERRIETVLHLDENRYPEIVAPESVIVEEFELSKAEAGLLKELDGTSSVHFILAKAPSMNLAPFIAALVLGGGLELRAAPTGARQAAESRPVPPEFRTQRRARFIPEDHTQPLTPAPVPQPRPAAGETPPPVKREPTHSSPTIAAAQIAPRQRRSSRENLAPPTTEAQERARDALLRLKSDLDSRKPVNKKRRWPEPKDDKERRLMAESAFHQGRLHLRAEEAERALPGLHRAHELCPDEREYELYVKWAQMLVNDSFKNDPQRAEVQALAARIVRENRECELGYSILGHCAMHDGKDEAALRFFQRAANLDPKLVDAGRFARLLAMRLANKPRKASPSKVEASARKTDRGLLDTPLDEIVPVLVQRAADALHTAVKNATARDESKPSSRERVPSETGIGPLNPPPPASEPTVRATPATPDSKAHRIGATTAPMPAASTPPPAPPLPASLPPPPLTLPAALPEAPPADVNAPPAPLRAPVSPWRLHATEPAEAQSQFVAASTPPPSMRPQVQLPSVIVEPEDSRPPKPRSRLWSALIAAWFVSIGITASIFYFAGNKGDPSKVVPSPPSETAARVDPTTPPPLEAPVPSESAATTVSASTTPISPPPPASASAAPSSKPDGKPATTGILRAPHAHGHRVFIDGRSVGEGPRDHVVSCGNHRVKIGSAGVERTVAIPCGGSIEVD
jgi:hypothetical protein